MTLAPLAAAARQYSSALSAFDLLLPEHLYCVAAIVTILILSCLLIGLNYDDS